MEAPKTIYLYPSDRVGEEYEEDWGDKPWGEGCIEYTRTDAFIEKAVQFIKVHFQFEDPSWYKDGEPTVKDEAIEDFRKYMKGE